MCRLALKIQFLDKCFEMEIELSNDFLKHEISIKERNLLVEMIMVSHVKSLNL